MNTGTQKPSEHAIRAAHRTIRNLYCSHESREADVLWVAEVIDQHAIAPAVAERDKRIAELVNGFLRIASMTMSHVVTAQDGFTRCREIADEMLAKHGGSHE